MKFTTTSATAAVLMAGSVYAGTGKLMNTMMAKKTELREHQRAMGRINTASTNHVGERCRRGKAGEYACNNIDMWGFLSHGSMGSTTMEGNDVWGWTSSKGREFAIVGQTDGTAFVEVLPNGSMDYIGRLPPQTEDSIWRDIKVIGDYAYIGSEAANYGMQIFDLKKILDVKPARWSRFTPKTFSIETDLTAHYSEFGSSHNIVANPATNMVYAVGTADDAGCSGGLWMVDVSNPAEPTSKGCVSLDGYVHDAQCVVYNGVDTAFNGHEICFNYDEDALAIVDVTDKSSPVMLSRTDYNGVSYTHQGWVADSEFRVLLLDDELDEYFEAGPAASQKTITYIVDISDLTKPVFTGTYQGPVKSVDHNQYVIDGLSYQSNYGSGLRIVDVSSAAQGDLAAAEFKEVAYFDCYPEDDGEPAAEFYGAWSVYPYFKSNILVLNTIERGLFALKYTGRQGHRH